MSMSIVCLTGRVSKYLSYTVIIVTTVLKFYVDCYIN